jgi:DNA polymerase-1
MDPSTTDNNNNTTGDSGAMKDTGGGKLAPQHIEYLRARAVPEDVAIKAGLRSVSAEEAGRLLNRKGPTPSGGLAIPYLGVSPPTWRFRPDTPGDGPRYLCESGRQVPVYIPPLPAADDLPTIVVESPIKALALTAAGLRAVGLGGTPTTLTTGDDPRRLNDSWKRIVVKDREVVILFDSNRAANANVARDEGALAHALELDGATVKIAALPLSPSNKSWGPDDFLASCGAEALKEVIARAFPADPVARAQSTTPESAPDLLDDLPFLIAAKERGSGCLKRVRDLLKAEGKISAKDFDSALSRATTKLKKVDGAVSTKDQFGEQYRVHNGVLCKIETQFVDGRVERVPIPLCNFAAEIQAETISDDGVTETRSFEVVGHTEAGRSLPRIVLTPDEFRNELWVMQHWGAIANVSATPGTANHLRAAMQTVSHPTIEREYTHTGWQQLEGGRVFLHAGGAIGASGIRTRLQGRLAHYVLPDEATDVADAVRISLKFLDVAERKITVPLFAAVYRAPLQHFFFFDTTIWAEGQTGSMKTTIAALAQAHFGDFSRSTMPAAWHDTAAHIENTICLAKDVLVVIDDFAPRGSAGWDELHRKGEQVLRSVGNQAARGRMRPDMSERPERPPRGLVMATGEDLPSGQSILARILPVHFERKQVNTAKLSELQAKQDRLPHAMAGFIDWLRLHLDGIEDRLRGRFVARRAEFHASENHLRAPEALAHLVVGIELFSEFVVDVGVFGKREAGHFVDEAVSILRQLGVVQGGTVAEEDAPSRFMGQLRELVVQGKVEIVDNREEKLVHLGATQQIGWRDQDAVYLLPDATFSVVTGAMRAAGAPMPLKAPTLWSRLYTAGLIKPGDAGHLTSKQKCGGGRPRVIVMSLQALELDDPNGGPKSGAPVPPAPNNGRKIGEEPGRETEKAGHETVKSGRHSSAERQAGWPQAGGGEEDQLLTSSSTPPRPGAPAEEEASHIEVPPAAAASCHQACGEPLLVDHARENRGIGAVAPNCADSQENLRPADDPAPRIVTGAQVLAVNYELIREPAQLAAVASAVEAAGEVTLDFETLGLDPLIDRPRLLQLGLPDGRVFVIDLFAVGSLGPVGEALKSTRIIAHNMHFELKFLKHCFGVEPKSGWDTMIAAKLLDKGQRRKEKYFTLQAVCMRELGIALPKEMQKSDWSKELTPEQLEYAARDVAVLWPLKETLASALAAAGLECAANLEFEVLAPVVDMELSGVRIDRDAWTSLFEHRQAEAERLGKLAAQALGVENINSSPQVLKALNRLGIAATATSAEALAPFINHPQVVALLQYRTAVSFPRNIGEHVMDALKLDLHRDGRIHPHLNPLAAPTGRFGCAGPNLLAMPKETMVRQAIIAPPGFVFVSADYHAIELRVLAHVTKDSALTKIFNEKGDPHRRTAAAMLGIDESEVSDDDRASAKPVNFGFPFGMGAETFVMNALTGYNVIFTLAQARRYKAVYLRTYRGVARWQEATRTRMSIEVRTASGRIRRFNDRRKGYCERLNTPIQGTAADGMKAALILLHRRLPALGARLILCVHDEVLVEAPKDRAEEVKAVVESSMIEGMKRFVTAVPIVVEADIRPTWAKPPKNVK